jgi:hypothetical protein
MFIILKLIMNFHFQQMMNKNVPNYKHSFLLDYLFGNPIQILVSKQELNKMTGQHVLLFTNRKARHPIRNQDLRHVTPHKTYQQRLPNAGELGRSVVHFQ